MELSSAARRMAESKHTPSCENQWYIETPVGLRKLTNDIMDKDFSGFRDERGNMKRLINVERELRYMEVMLSLMDKLMDKQDQLIMENTELKLRFGECEKVSAINQGLKEEIQEIKKQNDVLKATCHHYESSLRSLQVKVQDGIVDRAEGGLGENKLKELRNERKQEQEEEQVKFSEVVKRQIQENTKVAVIEIIKEKDLVRDTVDKKKSFVIFGMKEEQNPNKFTRTWRENWPKLLSNEFKTAHKN
ncbi:hypothetical protein E2C01_088855 [Portunus trituberculatus]|uniref:Uncharacterized protein n=1 Tax=Portunus trituberculatus TaxID=210409 RepID=A0A5B7JGK6_PORTR|nr:hypothetical protein [Portunus trituberculatus]